MSGKFSEVIKKAKGSDQNPPEAAQTIKQDNQRSESPEEKMVNLCVKIPKFQRQHWAAEAKRHGITMTEVITEALTKKFGLPNNQNKR